MLKADNFIKLIFSLLALGTCSVHTFLQTAHHQGLLMWSDVWFTLSSSKKHTGTHHTGASWRCCLMISTAGFSFGVLSLAPKRSLFHFTVNRTSPIGKALRIKCIIFSAARIHLEGVCVFSCYILAVDIGHFNPHKIHTCSVLTLMSLGSSV